MNKRSYQQNCSLALGLDSLGERWTFLMIRELLTGPKRYKEMVENLPAMGTNLLANRLKALIAEELIFKQGHHYHLTDKGKATEEILFSIIRWGLAYSPGDNIDRGDFLHKEKWDKVAIKALFRPQHPLPDFSVAWCIDQCQHYFIVKNQELDITQDYLDETEIQLTGSRTEFEQIATKSDFIDAVNTHKLKLVGDSELAWTFMHCFT